MNANPSAILQAGITILEPILGPHGFVFVFQDEGRGSGGDFAWAEFVRDVRRLELHVRYALGIVVYHHGDLWLDHTQYMRALGVTDDQRQYPGFSSDPMAGFQHLAHDLSRYAGEFLAGDASILQTAAPLEAVRRAREQHVVSAKYEGDEHKRREARSSFRKGNFGAVVTLLEALHYPDLLHESERRMLDIARTRPSTSAEHGFLDR